MANRTIPAISVIIPMYNTEKYIGECLDSILAQTFTDFEVIVVDDCSTDNSAAIVESYIPKFDGKLQLVRSKINSGGAGTPRNIGLRISLGKYIFFMDSDDAIVSTAFEVLNQMVEKFQPEVIHCDRYYKAPENTVTTDKKFLQEVSLYPPTPPSFMSENVLERIQPLVNMKFRWEPWTHLIERKFIMEHDFKFSNLKIADDFLFSLLILFTAKKILLVPDTFYVWRIRQDSNSKETLPTDKLINRRAGDIFKSVGILDKFLNGLSEFANDPRSKYTIFEFFTIHGGIYALLQLYTKVPPHQLDGLIRRELEQIEDKTALTAFLFNRMNVFNVNLIQQQNLIRQQQAQIKQLQSQIQQIQQIQKSI